MTSDADKPADLTMAYRRDKKDYVEIINDPLIELLAIKLFEHDQDAEERYNWLMMPNVVREIYRSMARGEMSIGPDQPNAEKEGE